MTLLFCLGFFFGCVHLNNAMKTLSSVLKNLQKKCVRLTETLLDAELV